MKHHISYFYNALLEYYSLQEVHQIQRNKLTVTKVSSKCPPLVRTQAHKRVGH